ncbi:CDR1, partial [Candida theae]
MGNLEQTSSRGSSTQSGNEAEKNPSDHQSRGNYRGFNDEDVHRLAKKFSRDDSSSPAPSLRRYLTHMSEVPGVNPLLEEEKDERLDPDSDKFDAKFWVKNQRKQYELDKDYYKPSKLGVAYRNLRA